MPVPRSTTYFETSLLLLPLHRAMSSTVAGGRKSGQDILSILRNGPPNKEELKERRTKVVDEIIQKAAQGEEYGLAQTFDAFVVASETRYGLEPEAALIAPQVQPTATTTPGVYGDLLESLIQDSDTSQIGALLRGLPAKACNKPSYVLEDIALAGLLRGMALWKMRSVQAEIAQLAIDSGIFPSDECDDFRKIIDSIAREEL